MAGTSVEALSTAAETLVANGYGTSSTVRKIEALGDALGCPVRCMVEWGQISLTTPEGDPVATLQVRPENINMSKERGWSFAQARSHSLNARSGSATVSPLSGRRYAERLSPTRRHAIRSLTRSLRLR